MTWVYSWKVAGSLIDKTTSQVLSSQAPSHLATNHTNVLLLGTLTSPVTAFLIPFYLYKILCIVLHLKIYVFTLKCKDEVAGLTA